MGQNEGRLILSMTIWYLDIVYSRTFRQIHWTIRYYLMGGIRRSYLLKKFVSLFVYISPSIRQQEKDINVFNHNTMSLQQVVLRYSYWQTIL